MSDDLDHTRFDQVEPYQRARDESADEYEAFVQWCRMPVANRNYGNFVRVTGLPLNWAQRTAKKNRWVERASAFDRASEALRPDPASMEEEASKAAQLAAATMLLDLGLQAIALKNPAHIKVSDARQLVKEGVEIQRRALGEADITVSVKQENADRISGMVDEILELEAEDVEVVEDEDDDAGDREAGA